jgi:hypothetical protein
MGAMKKQTSSNDYAVAKVLNDCVINLIGVISLYQIIGPLKEFDITELNRAYILLVDELEKIYRRTPKLSNVKPEPTWRKFESLKGSIHTIEKYLEQHDPGNQHRDKVERLSIVAGNENPDFSQKQKVLVETNSRKCTLILRLID